MDDDNDDQAAFVMRSGHTVPYYISRKRERNELKR